MKDRMADGNSPDIETHLSKVATTFEEAQHKTPAGSEYHPPKMSRWIKIKATGAVIAGALGAACGIAHVTETRRPASPTPDGLGGAPTDILPNNTEVFTSPTVTLDPIETQTQTPTPTEFAPFTETEIEAADPFDFTTFPELFQKMQDPEFIVHIATGQQKEDYDSFLKAVRIDKGIAKTKGENELDNFYEARDWMEAHPEEVKGKKLELSALEVIELLKQKYPPVWRDTDGTAYGFDLIQAPANPNQQYSSDNIGDIVGENINTERIPFLTVRGKLLGFAEIGGQTLILIDMKNEDGSHVVFPAVINVEKGTTLKKGSKCMTLGGKSSVYTFEEDVDIGPLWTTNRELTWDILNNSIGNKVVIHSLIVYPNGESVTKNGVQIQAFSETLRIQIAGGIDIIKRQP